MRQAGGAEAAALGVRRGSGRASALRGPGCDWKELGTRLARVFVIPLADG